MVKAGVSTRFEDTIIDIDTRLTAVIDAGRNLLATIPRAAGTIQMPDEEALGALGARRLELLLQQKSAYGEIASHVATIGVAVEEERAIFDRREKLQTSDLFLGFFSKKRMRRRIEQRAARAGGVDRLRIVLGRADRLAGRVEAHRQAVMNQRRLAEDALDLMAGRKAKDATNALEAGDGDSAKAGGRPAFESIIGLIDPVARAFNGGVRDLNLLLQKLSLDIEKLLDLYSVLLSFERGREAHFLSPDAYPHLTQPVWRLGNGLLPGAWLDRSRQRTDSAFVKRFEDA